MAVKPKTGKSARITGYHNVHYLHRRWAFNSVDPGAAPVQGHPNNYLGVLPADSVSLETYCFVRTAMAGADFIIGTSAAGSSAAVVSTQDVVGGTTGLYKVDRYMGTVSTVDTALYIQAATSGGTAGEVDVFHLYLPVVKTTY